MTATPPLPAAATPGNGADWLLHALIAEGVDTLFGYPGGTIMPFYDALHRMNADGERIRHVLVRHEQGAAFAANGYARASGRVGVCVATSGPGASNLVTGIADAFGDSVPMVAITGQVAEPLIGTDAFQELDVFSMTRCMVKHSWRLRHVDELPRVVAEAFRIAREGRPGPVLIDLPKDLQMADAAHLPAHRPLPCVPTAPAEADALTQAAALLATACRPLLYGGGGLAAGHALDAFRRFAERSGIPAVLTLKALGALPPQAPGNLGMLGMHGNRAANLAAQECDVLIVAGARFDDRATGKLAEFAPLAKVLHLDADPSEISRLRHADAAVPGHLSSALDALAEHPDARPSASTEAAREAWRARCFERRERHAPRYDAPGTAVYAPALLRQLSRMAPDAIVSCDVGQHQMWVAQHWQHQHPRQHLTSGALGAMGFGLPAAIGAQLQDPAARVICVSGDGSFLMNVQELATIARYRLPVKIVLLDNQALGMVRQWQELFFAKRFSEIDLSDNPDFAALAEAFGIPALHLDRAADCTAALTALLDTPGPALLHVRIEREANVWPLVPPNHNNAQMLEGSPAAPAAQETADALPA